jgi:hypothetical protein
MKKKMGRENLAGLHWSVGVLLTRQQVRFSPSSYMKVSAPARFSKKKEGISQTNFSERLFMSCGATEMKQPLTLRFA